MELVSIRENALTVELSWGDCNHLAHIIQRAIERDALSDTADFALTDAYARTVLALLQAGGMATWAYTCTREEFTLEEFRAVAPTTPEDRARAEARYTARPPDPPPGDDAAPPAPADRPGGV